MNQEDIILINKIINLSNTIYKLYNNLFNLEINNHKDTKDYKQELNYLSICLEIENELYNKIKFTNIHQYMNYIDSDNSFRYLSDYDLLINNDKDLIVKKRIYNNLNRISFFNLVNIYQNDIENKNDIPSFDHLTFINNTIHDDIEKTVIFLSQEESKKIEDKKLKNNLVKTKYLLSYLNKRIENNLNVFNNNYNELFLSSNTTKDLLNIDNSIYNKLLKKYFQKYIKIYINDLINTKDIDYNNSSLKVIIIETIIRSYIKIKQDNLDYLKKLIHDTIIKNKKNDNQASIYILENLLDKTDNFNKIKILKSERLVLYENSK